MLRLGEFTPARSWLDGVARFRGERGVVQLRALAPLTAPSLRRNPCCGCTGWSSLPPASAAPASIVDDFGRVIFRLDLADPGRVSRRSTTGSRSIATGSATTRSGDWIKRNRGIHVEVFDDADLFRRDADPDVGFPLMYAIHAR